MSTELPRLTEEPIHYADYCLSLSTKLLDVLTAILQDGVSRGLILSIGSGSGLLEALLSAQWALDSSHAMEIEGVEVFSSLTVNRYLPEEAINTVAGTWDLSSRIVRANALLFVYPRQPGLVKRYMDLVSNNECPATMVIWLGPRADWVDYKSCFLDATGCEAVEIVADCGLLEYEMMALLQRYRST